MFILENLVQFNYFNILGCQDSGQQGYFTNHFLFVLLLIQIIFEPNPDWPIFIYSRLEWVNVHTLTVEKGNCNTCVHSKFVKVIDEKNDPAPEWLQKKI